MSDAVLEFRDVSKVYRLGRSPVRSLRDEIGKLAKRLTGRPVPKPQQLTAVEDVSFTVRPGEAVGLVGPNGAGKTTTLRLIAGITLPTTGSVVTNGRLGALIELGAGFHLELTGKENIFLNGAILGLSRDEIRDRFDDIVAFSEMEGFLDTPLKRYSSGMLVRLGFSIASHLDPDILLVDEVLAVGDFPFRQKCLQKMSDLRREGKTLVFVSHNLGHVARLCDRAVLLHKGRVETEGSVTEALDAYQQLIAEGRAVPRMRKTEVAKLASDDDLMDVRILDAGGEPVRVVRPEEPVDLVVRFRLDEPVHEPGFVIRVMDSRGVMLFEENSSVTRPELSAGVSGKTIEVKYRCSFKLLAGSYLVGAGLFLPGENRMTHYRDAATGFVIDSEAPGWGPVDLAGDLSIRAVGGSR